MYKLKINLFDCTIRIPLETVATLGMPEEITFLYNRDKAVLAVAAGPVQFDGTGRGRPPQGMGITLKDKWEEESGCYKIETALYTMEAFSKALPYNDVRSAFVLSGDFIEKAVIAFELGSAIEEENRQYLEALAAQKDKRRTAYPTPWDEKEAIRNALHDPGHPRERIEIPICD